MTRDMVLLICALDLLLVGVVLIILALSIARRD